MTSSYLSVMDKGAFPQLADVDLLYLDGPYVYAEYAEGAQAHLSLIPPQNYGPPERCYAEIETDHPGFVVHSFGAGQGIYLPWLPGALFHRQGYPNTTWFIADLLENVAGLTPIGGNLSPMVESTHFGSKTGAYDLLHLVNGSGHFGASFFAPVPMHGLRLELPLARRPTAVRSLVHGKDYDHQWQGGTLTVTVPLLELFDAVRIEFS
jgi:hypothetical protein